MSTAIHFYAHRDIQVIKTGVIEHQNESFAGVWQTPTAVTCNIIGEDDPIEAYKEWIRHVTQDYEAPIYAHDDYLDKKIVEYIGIGPIIGYETRNDGRDHCEELEKWMNDVTARGFEVITKAW
jgi:hypothetical protein